MSAFVVGKLHIDYLVAAGIGFGLVDETTASGVGKALWAENRRSVNHRYRENEPADEYTYAPIGAKVDPVQTIKAAHCYRYQSCETSDWEQTVESEYVKDLERKALEFLGKPADFDSGKLAGYSDAQWEVREIKKPEAKTGKCPSCGAEYAIEDRSGIRLCWKCQAPVDAHGNNEPATPKPEANRAAKCDRCGRVKLGRHVCPKK